MTTETEIHFFEDLKPVPANMRIPGGTAVPPEDLRNLKFQIDCHDLLYFLKFMIIREKLIPHVFRCRDHILTLQMGTQDRDFHFPYQKATTQNRMLARTGFKHIDYRCM